jgi:hypothetical protein
MYKNMVGTNQVACALSFENIDFRFSDFHEKIIGLPPTHGVSKVR